MGSEGSFVRNVKSADEDDEVKYSQIVLLALFDQPLCPKTIFCIPRLQITTCHPLHGGGGDQAKIAGSGGSFVCNVKSADEDDEAKYSDSTLGSFRPASVPQNYFLYSPP